MHEEQGLGSNQIRLSPKRPGWKGSWPGQRISGQGKELGELERGRRKGKGKEGVRRRRGETRCRQLPQAEGLGQQGSVGKVTGLVVGTLTLALFSGDQ